MEDFEIRVPKPGEVFEHYKGGLYQVITVGRLSEQRDQLMVVYKSLERGHIWIRPLGMWLEYVDRWSEGLARTESVPRFALVNAAPER